jgi:aspartate/methionine/tyrosine aminotransferase
MRRSFPGHFFCTRFLHLLSNTQKYKIFKQSTVSYLFSETTMQRVIPSSIDLSTLHLPEDCPQEDISHLCKSRQVPTLDQTMIEATPPQLLLSIASKMVLDPQEHFYHPRCGSDRFRQGIVHDLRSRMHASHISEAHIHACHGVSGGFAAILHLIKLHGITKIGLLEPFHAHRLDLVRLIFGSDPLIIPTVGSHACGNPDLAAVRRALSAGMGALLLSNPANPSGRLCTKEELQTIITEAAAKGCYVVIDESFADLVWDPPHERSAHLTVPSAAPEATPNRDRPLPVAASAIMDPNLLENTFVVRGFAHSLSLQSWRCAYIVSAPQNIAELAPVHDALYVSVSFLQDAIGEFLLKHHDMFTAYIRDLTRSVQENWDIMAPAFEQTFHWTPKRPQAGIFGAFEHHRESDQRALEEALRRHVCVATCREFTLMSSDNSKFVRINCAVSRQKALSVVRALGGEHQSDSPS